ncbi:MAG: lipopolysaccharide assembly protein LapA domain-containing protein [Pseudomonadota bacterium]
MLRRIVLFFVVLAVVAAVVVFWGVNQEPATIDLGFDRFETVLAAIVVASFILGWLFGLLCASLFLLRVANDRRRVRKKLRLAEAEVSSLRSLPLQDAGD